MCRATKLWKIMEKRVYSHRAIENNSLGSHSQGAHLGLIKKHQPPILGVLGICNTAPSGFYNFYKAVTAMCAPPYTLNEMDYCSYPVLIWLWVCKDLCRGLNNLSFWHIDLWMMTNWTIWTSCKAWVPGLWVQYNDQWLYRLLKGNGICIKSIYM